jgi:hypothetical protein
MSIDTFLLSADTTDLDYPEIRPTLDLNFARVKALDPRITFTRASGGSYVGADGLIKYAGVNEARFDHDPETGESLGLLVEEARTNLLLRSEEFDNAYWFKFSSFIVPNAVVAPDGTNTADKLVEDTTPNNNHIVFRGPLGLSSNVYTFSVYVKAAERNEIVLRIDTNVTQRNVRFNLVEGTIVDVGDVSARIEYVGNGWYRCINTMNIAEEVINAALMLADSRFPLAFYTGDGTSGIYVWGAQLEEGAFPTSYIPTVASTRTRAADNASITGKNFSDWYRQDEGTVYSSYITRVPTNANQNNVDFVIENATSTNRIIGWNNFSKQSVFSLVENNVANYIFLGSISKINTPVKKIIGIKDFDVKIYVGTDALIGDFASSIPDKTPRNLTRMFIGVGNGYSALNGTISRLTYYPKRLTNQQLQALTR